MDSQKQSVLDRLKQANNILITVSASPSVDQLAACIGLTLLLNELEKHATAVFSGNVPSTLEFLQPEKTLERNTDSLRDFIIALDKSKADKLRYKVEDKVVKIFITPYRTSISEKDLEFSQGDFNVDAVVCLGVHDQRDLDQAITSHGRILHDATVIGINNSTVGSSLGTLNWQDPQASSLSEMIASMADGFDKKNLLDTQIATALLTGVVAETDRFSNSKTSPETMKVSAQLMAAGANQQLVATKLAEPVAQPEPIREEPPTNNGNGGQSAEPPKKNNDGTLRIEHDNDEVNLPPVQPPSDNVPPPVPPPPPLPPTPPEEEQSPIRIDEDGSLRHLGDEHHFLGGADSSAESILPQPDRDEERPSGAPPEPPKFVLAPPTLGGTLTANSQPEGLEPTTDPLSQLIDGRQPMLTHNSSNAAAPLPAAHKVIQPPQPGPAAAATDHKTLTDIEKSVSSPHVAPADESSARVAVENAVNNAPFNPAGNPTSSLGARPLGSLHSSAPVASPTAGSAQGNTDNSTSDEKSEKPAEPAKLEPITEPLGKLAEPLPSPVNEPAPAADSPSAQPLDMPLPPALTLPPANATPPTSSNNDSPPGPPPPVPPPFMPQPIEPNGQ